MSIEDTQMRILALAILKANKALEGYPPLNIHSINIYCGHRGDHSDQAVQGLSSQGASVLRMKRHWVVFFFGGNSKHNMKRVLCAVKTIQLDNMM